MIVHLVGTKFPSAIDFVLVCAAPNLFRANDTSNDLTSDFSKFVRSEQRSRLRLIIRSLFRFNDPLPQCPSNLSETGGLTVRLLCWLWWCYCCAKKKVDVVPRIAGI